jgi:hypothetical protein
MRKTVLMLVIVLAAAACGGDSDLIGSVDGQTQDPAATTGQDEGSATDAEAPDPCTLAGDAVLTSYFGTASLDGERGQAGPIQSCSFRDANANSLLVQVATGHPLFRPDPCEGCLDLSFAHCNRLRRSSMVISGSR